MDEQFIAQYCPRRGAGARQGLRTALRRCCSSQV